MYQSISQLQAETVRFVLER